MKRRAFLITSSASFLTALGLYGLRANPQTLRRDAKKAYTCKILAIDGGGIRGVIPAYILKQLEADLGKPITNASTSSPELQGNVLDRLFRSKWVVQTQLD